MILSLTVSAQSKLQMFHEVFNDYIEYCNEETTDTIQQIGTINIQNIPVYDCGKIVYYKKSGLDTIWKDVKCSLYKEDFDSYSWRINSITCDTFYTSGFYYNPGIYQQKDSETIKRNYFCSVKREKPSQAGFYKWLFFKLK